MLNGAHLSPQPLRTPPGRGDSARVAFFPESPRLPLAMISLPEGEVWMGVRGGEIL